MFRTIVDANGKERMPTYSEAMRQLEVQSRAKQQAKQQAEYREAERKAAQPKQPVNAAAIILDKMQALPRRMREQLQREADQRGRQIEAQEAEQARKAALDKDAAVINARDNAGFLLKAAGEEFHLEAVEAAAIADEGDVQLYWAKVRELEQKIWERDDRLAQEKLAARQTSGDEFSAAAQRAVESQKRLEAANANASE